MNHFLSVLIFLCLCATAHGEVISHDNATASAQLAHTDVVDNFSAVKAGLCRDLCGYGNQIPAHSDNHLLTNTDADEREVMGNMRLGNSKPCLLRTLVDVCFFVGIWFYFYRRFQKSDK